MCDLYCKVLTDETMNNDIAMWAKPTYTKKNIEAIRKPRKDIDNLNFERLDDIS